MSAPATTQSAPMDQSPSKSETDAQTETQTAPATPATPATPTDANGSTKRSASVMDEDVTTLLATFYGELKDDVQKEGFSKVLSKLKGVVEAGQKEIATQKSKANEYAKKVEELEKNLEAHGKDKNEATAMIKSVFEEIFSKSNLKAEESKKLAQSIGESLKNNNDIYGLSHALVRVNASIHYPEQQGYRQTTTSNTIADFTNTLSLFNEQIKTPAPSNNFAQHSDKRTKLDTPATKSKVDMDVGSLIETLGFSQFVNN